jgi:hypothetical protein
MTPPRLADTTAGDETTMRGRLEKAKGFLESAEALHDLGSEGGVLAPTSRHANSYVAECILAGIAAADALCIRRTGRYHRSTNHDAAVAVLRDATDRSTAKHLQTLVNLKNKAEYWAKAVDAADIRGAGAAALALVAAAEDAI